MTFRFSGKVPGKTAKGNIRSYVGALALTNERVLGTLSSVPKKAGRAVDHQWNARGGSMVQATLDESGLLLDVPDISVVDPTLLRLDVAALQGAAVRGRADAAARSGRSRSTFRRSSSTRRAVCRTGDVSGSSPST